MSDDDKELRKGARNRKGRSKGKVSESSSEDSRYACPESLIEEKLEIESERMSDLGIQLIKAVKKPYDSGDEVRQLLAQGAPVNYQEKNTEATALHLAAGYNDLGAVEAIMAQPEINYLIRDNQGRLVSELASKAGNTELAEILIGKIKEQADSKGVIAHMRHNEVIGGGSGSENDPNP